MGAMRPGHVCGVGGVLPAPPPATMRGDASAFEKQFDGGGGEPSVDPLVQELVGDAVIVVVDQHVVVDVHAGVGPLGDLVPGRGQRAQQGAVKLVEEVTTGDTEPAHHARVERGQQRPDRRVELSDAEEAAVAQRGQDPALGQEHTRLDDRLIPRRFPGTPATPCIWMPTRTTSAVVAKASPTLPQNGSTNYGVVLILRVNLSAIRLCNA